MTRIPMALAVLFLGASSFGCVSRTITRFEDNSKSPVTAMEVNKRFSVLGLYSKMTHQFYLCQDTGTQLTCKLSCDGPNDAVCPVGTTTDGTMTTTNVR